MLCVCYCVCRYSVDIPFDKQVVNKECLKDLKTRRRARFEIKKKLEERFEITQTVIILLSSFLRHKLGKNRWFFQKLRF